MHQEEGFQALFGHQKHQSPSVEILLLFFLLKVELFFIYRYTENWLLSGGGGLKTWLLSKESYVVESGIIKRPIFVNCRSRVEASTKRCSTGFVRRKNKEKTNKWNIDLLWTMMPMQKKKKKQQHHHHQLAF